MLGQQATRRSGVSSQPLQNARLHLLIQVRLRRVIGSHGLGSRKFGPTLRLIFLDVIGVLGEDEGHILFACRRALQRFAVGVKGSPSMKWAIAAS